MGLVLVYQNLGPQWASTILACIGTAMSVLPFVFYKFGPAIRDKSKYAKELINERKEGLQAEKYEVTASATGQRVGR
jgi:MFS transporter, DHA1 family, multidrug resistance protein